MTKAVATKARKEAGEGSKKAKLATVWATVGGMLGGGALTTFGVAKLQNKGLLGGTNKKDIESSIKKCTNNVTSARTEYNKIKCTTNSGDDTTTCERTDAFSSAVRYANAALSAAGKA